MWCVPVAVSASDATTTVRPAKDPFVVEGKVYCDTCQAGFEVTATTYIAGATIALECKDRNSNEVVFHKEAITDASGTYKIFVTEDQQDQVCDVTLVSSPQSDCAKVSPGRERALVILTGDDGTTSNTRHVNALGFVPNEQRAGCADIVKEHQETEDEYSAHGRLSAAL